MASRPSKLLRSLSAVSGISGAALSRVLGIVRSTPEIISDACGGNRMTVQRAVMSAAKEAGHSEHVVELDSGPPLVWEVLTLQGMIPYLCKECPPFLDALREIFATYGADWRIVLYSDGLTPGSVLAPENKRKSFIWYATLLEFAERLCHQELWFCLANIQTSVVKTVPGQISALTKLVLRDMFCGDGALNTVGLILPVGKNGKLEMVRLHFHALLADEEGLQMMLGLKGASGIVPCAMRCWCVAKEREMDRERGIPALADRAANIADITCTNKDDILLKGDADVWSDCDYLVSNVGDGEFALMQKCIGINYLPTGLLFARELRPTFKPSSSHRYDGLHVLFAGGIVPSEFMLFF